MKYLALLRGINVGGNSIIKMNALKACFENMGFEEVSTYIQSGNVLFSSSLKNLTKLEDLIEKGLTQNFGVNSRVVVLTTAMLQKTIEEVPPKFGQEPEKYRYDVIFTKTPLVAKEALPLLPIKDGVDHASAGTHALYFSRLISKATQSHLSRLIKLPLYKSVTIRNWNTTTKLLALMSA